MSHTFENRQILNTFFLSVEILNVTLHKTKYLGLNNIVFGKMFCFTIHWVMCTNVVVLVKYIGSSQLGQALRFVEEPNSIVALRNSQVSLNCTATAGQTSSSPTRVFWRKDGVRVRPNSNVLVLSSGHLLLRQFRGRKGPQNDEGVYQCFASNEEGTIASRKARVRLAGEYRDGCFRNSV